MPLIGRLQDRLAQPLLALRREQQPFHERPALRPGRAEQGDDHVPPHQASRVPAAPDLDQGGEHPLPARAVQVDRRREQVADHLRRPVPIALASRQVATPDSQPGRIGQERAGRGHQAGEVIGPAIDGQTGAVHRAERLPVPGMLVLAAAARRSTTGPALVPVPGAAPP